VLRKDSSNGSFDLRTSSFGSHAIESQTFGRLYVWETLQAFTRASKTHFSAIRRPNPLLSHVKSASKNTREGHVDDDAHQNVLD
jgi:hypothetical protein